MADEKAQTSEAEREYTIPLRREWRKVPRYKRTNKAVKAIKEFMVRHMKIRDRDLKKVKIDRYLNEELWFRGIKKPPSRIKVKAFMDGEIVRVQLSEMPEKLKFKKLREENREKRAEEMAKARPELKRHEHAHEEKKVSEEKAEEQKQVEKEKKAASIEAEGKIEKQLAKRAKHQTKHDKQPKHQKRMALSK